MTTQKFFTLQDYRTKLKPGTFVYPCFVNNERKYTGYDKIGPRWYSSNPIVRANKLDSWNKSFLILPDVHIRHFIKNNTNVIKKHKYAKAFYVNFDALSLFYSKTHSEHDTSTESISVSYPDPIGIYVGEILQPTWDNGVEIMLQRAYAKLLTLDGQIVWARI